MASVSMPTLDFGSGGITGEAASGLSIPFSLDMTMANRELNTFFKEAGKNLKLTADASGVVSAGRSALNSLRSLYSSTTLNVRANVQTSSTFGGGINLNTMLKAATGGRFTKPQQVEIAEDGDPEYVIPVKKEGIAVPLLRQLIGELSASARESLQSGSLNELSGMLASAGGANAPTVNQTNNNSVQAPVSINVTASGSDPEAVGRSVYDVAEQYLLRTIRGTISG
jgi:SLT domain-containing protein